jgi:hypothetical protein
MSDHVCAVLLLVCLQATCTASPSSTSWEVAEPCAGLNSALNGLAAVPASHLVQMKLCVLALGLLEIAAQQCILFAQWSCQLWGHTR